MCFCGNIQVQKSRVYLLWIRQRIMAFAERIWPGTNVMPSHFMLSEAIVHLIIMGARLSPVCSLYTNVGGLTTPLMCNPAGAHCSSRWHDVICILRSTYLFRVKYVPHLQHHPFWMKQMWSGRCSNVEPDAREVYVESACAAEMTAVIFRNTKKAEDLSSRIL